MSTEFDKLLANAKKEQGCVNKSMSLVREFSAFLKDHLNNPQSLIEFDVELDARQNEMRGILENVPELESPAAELTPEPIAPIAPKTPTKNRRK